MAPSSIIIDNYDFAWFRLITYSTFQYLSNHKSPLIYHVPRELIVEAEVEVFDVNSKQLLNDVGNHNGPLFKLLLDYTCDLVVE